jgi:hypothetical protein
MTLLRSFFLVGCVYLYFVMAFPDFEGQVYHVASLSIIAGGCVGLYVFLKIVEVSSGLVKLAAELAFALAVALYFGYTMPQKSGKPPIEQWAEGHRPSQGDARRGLERVGIDPHGALADRLVSLFPR